MAKKVTIQVDSDFRLREDELNFFNLCVEWAQKLNNIAGGGASVCFFRNDKYPEWSPFAKATFLWKGKFVAHMTWRSDYNAIHGYVFKNDKCGGVLSPFVDDTNVWDKVFSIGLSEAVREEREETLGSLEKKLPGVVWGNTPKMADGG